VSIDDTAAPDLLYCELDRIAGLVDAALQTPTPTHECLRCGNRWTGRTAHPKTCPLCHSAYWDTPATTAHGRTPSESERRRLQKAAKKRRRADRLRAKARKHGITLEPMPSTATDEKSWPQVGPTPTLPGEVIIVRERDEHSHTLSRPRTVPPPPGLEDLG
jgi:hypothetical protein